MSITDTISRVAATNPVIGAAVARQNADGAVLAGMQTGDTATSALLGALSGEAMEANQLLASLEPNLGRNVNTAA